MKKIEEWIAKLNQQQKLILGILIPIGFLMIFYPVASEFDGNPYFARPFNFEETWLVWLVYVGLVGFIEFKLFANRIKV